MSVEVGSKAIGQMRVARLDVHLIKQVMVHVMPVRIWVARKQADVFVEVEGPAEGEVQLFGAAPLDQAPVHRLEQPCLDLVEALAAEGDVVDGAAGAAARGVQRQDRVVAVARRDGPLAE